MKSISAISIAFYYLLATVGVSINTHYCNGQIDNVKLFTSASNCCCAFTGEMTNCCEDETVVFQIENDQEVSKVFRIKYNQPVDLKFVGEINSKARIIPNKLSSEKPGKDPPGKDPQPIWLINNSFIFYG